MTRTPLSDAPCAPTRPFCPRAVVVEAGVQTTGTLARPATGTTLCAPAPPRGRTNAGWKASLPDPARSAEPGPTAWWGAAAAAGTVHRACQQSGPAGLGWAAAAAAAADEGPSVAAAAVVVAEPRLRSRPPSSQLPARGGPPPPPRRTQYAVRPLGHVGPFQPADVQPRPTHVPSPHSRDWLRRYMQTIGSPYAAAVSVLLYSPPLLPAVCRVHHLGTGSVLHGTSLQYACSGDLQWGMRCLASDLSHLQAVNQSWGRLQVVVPGGRV